MVWPPAATTCQLRSVAVGAAGSSASAATTAATKSSSATKSPMTARRLPLRMVAYLLPTEHDPDQAVGIHSAEGAGEAAPSRRGYGPIRPGGHTRAGLQRGVGRPRLHQALHGDRQIAAGRSRTVGGVKTAGGHAVELAYRGA